MMRGERGFALVITLIVMALLVALLVEFVNETYVSTSHSHNFVASQQAGVLAESGAVAARRLLEAELGVIHPTYSSLQDGWANLPPQTDETGTLTVKIEEETGKLNLNVITNPAALNEPKYQMTQNLLRRLNLPTGLADAVVDWEDNVDVPPRPNGAKSQYYNTLQPPYEVKAGKLDTVEELGLVKGFTPLIVAQLKPYVTVYGAFPNEPDTKININTAPRELLASLDEKMSDDLVSRVLDFRKTKPIKALADVPGMEAMASTLALAVCYKGSIYRIKSEGKVGESVARVEAVVRINGTQSDIIYWREY